MNESPKKLGRKPKYPGLNNARNKFGHAMYRQTRKMGREWELTFPEWYQWWLDQGVDKNTLAGPVHKDFLCMVLIDETKPFKLGNIRAATHGANNIGKPSRTAGHTRPNAWKVKDPAKHIKYMPYLKHRSQAAYRLEDYELTFEDWLYFWPDSNWHRRGRLGHDLCLTRDNPDLPWNRSNCSVITRKEQIQRAHEYHAARGLIRGRVKGVPNKKKKLNPANPSTS